MVQSDNRLANLEEEMKLLKTEISRTLIDLRTLVMSETAPFREEGTGRPPEPGPRESPSTVRIEHSESVSQLADAPPAVSQPQQPAMAAQPPPVPAGPAYVAPQAPQPFAYPSAAGTDQGRRIIEQERRLAEQDRRMAEQEVRMAAMGRGVSARDVGHGDYEPAESHRTGPPEYWNAADDQERARSPVPVRTRSSTPDRGERDRRRQDQPGNEPDWPGQPNQTEDLSPRNAGINGERYTREQDPDEGYNPMGQNGQGDPVYEEYAELFMETREPDPRADRNIGPLEVDFNLLSSLVGWTSMAKQRVGQQRLNDVVELYLQTRRSSPGLRELLMLISNIVEEVPQGDATDPQECLDLLAQLHGILAQDLPMIDIQRRQLAVSE